MVLQVAYQPTVILFSRCPPVEPATIVRRRQMKINSKSSSSSMQEMGMEKMDEEITNWVDATSHFFQEDTRPIMLFDGVCNLCNGGVRFVRNNDRNRKMRFEALQSKAGKNLLRRSGRSANDISSVVLVEKNRSYIKSEAVLKIMEYMDLPFPQLAIFFGLVPLFVRDFVYENVASNRYTVFGRSDSCEI